jgi:hypothetical protein
LEDDVQCCALGNNFTHTSIAAFQGYFHNGKPSGYESTIGGLPAYVSGGANAPAAILILTDVYVRHANFLFLSAV